MEPGSRPPGRTVAAGPSEDDLDREEPSGSDGGGPDVEIIVATPGWRAAVPRVEAMARRAALAAWAEAGLDLPGGFTVLLADDASIKRLNTDHRGKVKPTNVLSFPGEMPGHLGDIALALGVVRREARANKRRVAAHLAHLVAHGTLHLAGHDHLQAGEARRMEQAEARIMRRLNLPNPWRGVT